MKIVNIKRFIWFLILVFLVVIFLIGPIGGYFFIKYQINTPLSEQATEKVFIIEKGESLEEIAVHLERADLIRNKFWFMAYVFYKDWTAQLKAAQYFLSPSWNISQIAKSMVKGGLVLQEVEVTIPEGFTLKQIDARLSQVGLIKAGDLLGRFELEGYLFPDTYRFYQGISLDEIIAKMRENFDHKLDEGLKNEIARQGKTIDEIIIMASLIEKEVAVDYDRQIVAGIFWKRLSIDYPLQSCATVAYILGVDKWRYSTEDIKVASPYNTYQNTGLPPGPICNPGLSAIKAAIYPQENDYNFFLSKPSGETVFSKTLEEHNENKAKYLQ